MTVFWGERYFQIEINGYYNLNTRRPFSKPENFIFSGFVGTRPYIFIFASRFQVASIFANPDKQSFHMSDCRLPPRYGWDLRSSGALPRVEWYVCTEVSALSARVKKSKKTDFLTLLFAARLSTQRPWLNPMAVQMGFVVDKAVLGTGFSLNFSLFPL
jgi:hypothetical protein